MTSQTFIFPPILKHNKIYQAQVTGQRGIMDLRPPLETNNQGNISIWEPGHNYFHVWIRGQVQKNQGTTELHIFTRKKNWCIGWDLR